MSEGMFSGEAAVDYPHIYAELRRMARQIRGPHASTTLNTTALVHEVWLKMSASRSQPQFRDQYLGTAAMAMRQILVDYARHRHAGKRDIRREVSMSASSAFTGQTGEALCLLGDRDGEQAATADDLLALDQALTRLEALDPDLARFVELRFFAGLTLEELASMRGVTIRTVTRTWTKARALLKVWIAEEQAG